MKCIRYILKYSNSIAAELAFHPRLAQLFAALNVETTLTWLGEFGGDTPKPVRLWSNSPFVHNLRRTYFLCSLLGTQWQTMVIPDSASDHNIKLHIQTKRAILET